MFEIVPNWHPVFVHFTIGLCLVSVALFTVAILFPARSWRDSLLAAARWNLWIGAGFAIVTVAAGLYAANTVAHDDLSHSAMIDHRNWGLAAMTIFIVSAMWLGIRERRGKSMTSLVLVPLYVGAALLTVTGLKGGELVFKYGLGVAVPAVTAEDHIQEAPEPETDHNADGHVH